MRSSEETEQQRHAATAAVLSGLKDWRAQHPTATFAEIEAAVDERLNGLRAQMLARLALASDAATLSDQPALARSMCAICGTRLEGRGRHTRTVIGQGNQAVPLARHYAVCPTCGVGLFPPR